MASDAANQVAAKGRKRLPDVRGFIIACACAWVLYAVFGLCIGVLFLNVSSVHDLHIERLLQLAREARPAYRPTFFLVIVLSMGLSVIGTVLIPVFTGVALLLHRMNILPGKFIRDDRNRGPD